MKLTKAQIKGKQEELGRAQAPAALGVARRYPRGQHGATPQPAPFNPRGYSDPDPRGS